MSWRSISGIASLFTRRITVDVAPAWHFVRMHPEPVLVGLGVVLRVLVYLINRTLWMDESALFGNIKAKPIFDFSQHLSGDQLAPYAFLIIERSIVHVLGTSRYAARLVPLVCGIAALFLFARLVRLVLTPRAALVALALFALSDDLIYYASELKPYSADLAVGLALTLAVLDVTERPVSRRQLIGLTIAAAAAPWCSFPSVFIVAGGGLTVIATALRAGRARDAAAWATVGLAWLVSFVMCYRASRALLNPYTTMYLFWDFAFLPLNPFEPGAVAKAVGIVLEVFVNPLNLIAPFWPWLGVIVPAGLLIAGGYSLARRRGIAAMLLISPIALAMIASAVGKYPFHGRLILELVPALFILIAEGTDVVYQIDPRPGKRGYIVVLILLMAYPCLTGIVRSAEKRPRNFNRHGDLQDNVFMK